MRKQLVKTIESTLLEDEKLTLLLGDIGVFGFRGAFAQFPDRVLNIGILEDATVSLAAGLAKSDLVPVIHTIAPFLVERCYEQIKVDFGYQALGGNFISVGASYDYAALGCTHHCPGDIGILQYIPGMEIFVPGTSAEFHSLFKSAYSNGKPSYFRLSERENSVSHDVKPGKAVVLKKGESATAVVFGPVLDKVMAAVEAIDVTVIYYTSVSPFDAATLRNNLSKSGKVLMVEPFYSGTMTNKVSEALHEIPVTIDSVGVPAEFLRTYGRAEDHDVAIGLTEENIRDTLMGIVNA
jgi:transketolase